MTLIYSLDTTGIYRPSVSVQHRNEEYDQDSFDTLLEMQEKHFWYRGRHRFLLKAFDLYLRNKPEPLAVADLGGGIGGWVRYLVDRHANRFSRVALADSSERALKIAKKVLPINSERYQIDLMNLGWENEWDIVFMLDVIEHLPDDIEAVNQAAKALKSGGLLFITTPALEQFWSYNDELAHHIRRYCKKDFSNLAQLTGLQLCDARFFMFFLSPLYWFFRSKKNIGNMTELQKKALMCETHKVPSAVLNSILTSIFSAETPLGHHMRFPLGTSILGIFRKP
jgi:SAM-dependent methyltransferase